MKRILSLILALFIVGTSMASPALAKPTKARSDIVTDLSKKNPKQVLTDKELFITMVNVIAEYGEIPASYKYIKVENSGEPATSTLYKAYQKAIYLDILKPSQVPLKFSGQATHKKMVQYTNLFYGEKVGGVVLVDGSELQAIDKKLTYDDLLFYASNYLSSKGSNAPIQNAVGFEELADAYRRLMTEHIDKDSLEQRQLIYGAIQGMAEATGDKYTMFFPPVQSQEFENEINGEFEGIGAVLDLTKPGELMITSTIAGSPAEKSGIMAGDRIMKVDDYEVLKTSAVDDVIRRIKGPAGTNVTLQILRGGQTLSITIVRAKIKMDLVTYKKLDAATSVIKINSFGNGTIAGFRQAIDQMNIDLPKRVIIDLRNDGGGNVVEVSDILDYFVPAGQNKFTMKTIASSEVAISTGQDAIFKDKEIVILVNKGTASASEIMATTIQDYFPKAKVVGETSYGKGSAQQLFQYADGASIKYTVAKWFSGKNNRTINNVGIKPDFEVALDQDKFLQGIDTQMDYARSLQY